MDLSNHSSPVVTDTAPINKSMMGILSSHLAHSPQSSSFSSGSYIKSPRKLPGKLDDVRSNGWLDAMIASSPPRKKQIKDFSCEFTSDENDKNYMNWMIKYPSALSFLPQIATLAKSKKIAIFLDYDGTLSPIVDDPDKAIISDEMRCAVRNAAKCFPTAIISGRSRNKVFELVGLPELFYAGSHGMDIMGPEVHDCFAESADRKASKFNLFQPAKEFIPMIDEVFRTLVDKTNNIKGSKVENHRFCVSVHYRNVDEKNWPTIGQIVHDTLKDYPRLLLTHGRKVLEVRPVIDWNKGKAVEFILDSLGFSKSKDVLPIYIGDDRTDEDAFKVLKKENRGCGILVSSIPKESDATFSLRDPTEVMKFLNSLVIWKMVEPGTSG